MFPHKKPNKLALTSLLALLLTGCNLTVVNEGGGTVTSNDNLINCGEVCKAEYNQATQVTLTATPEPGYRFLFWKGCEPATERSCSLTAGSSNKTVKANFGPILTYSFVDLDFESPQHKIGELPTFGFEPDLLTKPYPTYFDIKFGPLIGQDPDNTAEQVLVMEPQWNVPGTQLAKDLFSFPLAFGADLYNVSFDIDMSEFISSSDIIVYFNTNAKKLPLRINDEGDLFFQDTLITRIATNSKVTVTANFNFGDRTVTITANNGSAQLPLVDAGVDINEVDLNANPEESARLLLDNITVNGVYERTLTLPEPDQNGQYVIDFESYMTHGGSLPYQQRRFNLIDVGRVNSPGDPTQVDNGTTHARMSLNSRPIIYHQYGFGFSLKSLDMARYSHVVRAPSTWTLKAVTVDGRTLTHTLETSGLGLTFDTYELPATWKDLKYVEMESSVAIDNLVLEVTDLNTSWKSIE